MKVALIALSLAGFILLAARLGIGGCEALGGATVGGEIVFAAASSGGATVWIPAQTTECRFDLGRR